MVAHWKYRSGVLPMSINNVMGKYQKKYPVSLILWINNYLTNFYETGKKYASIAFQALKQKCILARSQMNSRANNNENGSIFENNNVN